MSKKRNLLFGGNPADNPEWKFEKKGVSGLSDKEKRKIGDAVKHSKAGDDIRQYIRSTKYLKESDIAKILVKGINEGRYSYKDVSESLKVLGADSAKTRSHLKKAKKEEATREANEKMDPTINKDMPDSAVNNDIRIDQNDQIRNQPTPEEYFSDRDKSSS